MCGRCKDGERFELGHADIDVMEELSKLVHRAPHKADDAFKPFRIRNSEIFSISRIKFDKFQTTLNASGAVMLNK